MNQEFILEKARQIRALILDVDGVFTDGRFFLFPNGDEIKQFHTQDGVGIKALQAAGISVGIISGRASDTVTRRMQELNIKHVYQGVETKIAAYNDLKHLLKLETHQIAYMGDDLPDLPVLMSAGLSIAPANACLSVLKKVDWVTTRAGGDAAVREVCELILKAQGHDA
jgi:3-deoxy-D-manno-octulosonate 8-phosphate phosphatase (KDO 8-P phosphatase)